MTDNQHEEGQAGEWRPNQHYGADKERIPINVHPKVVERLRQFLMDEAPSGRGYSEFIADALDQQATITRLERERDEALEELGGKERYSDTLVKRMVSEHFDHITDGSWYDECRLCKRRRKLGGTGIKALDDAQADRDRYKKALERIAMRHWGGSFENVVREYENYAEAVLQGQGNEYLASLGLTPAYLNERDADLSWINAVWTDGEKEITGRWTYLRHRETFVIVLDSYDEITQQQRRLEISGDRPEWKGWTRKA